MFWRVWLLSLVSVFFVTTAEVYDGYKVYDIKAKSEADLTFLKNLDTIEGDERSLDFLSFHNDVDEPIQLLVAPAEQKYIEKLLKIKKIEYKVAVADIQE
jgi:Carboxypeptidase activation peptide